MERHTNNQNRPVRLVIVIPAYNEEESIGKVLQAIPVHMDGVDEIMRVVIDDGSQDDTQTIASNSGARVVRHSRNLGIAEAFRTSIRVALEMQATIAVSIDADLQFMPSEIPRLVEPILAGESDFVAGNRFHQGHRPKNMSHTKYYGNRLMTRLVNLIAGEEFRDVSSGYRAYSHEALLNLNVQSSFTYTQESFLELAAKGLRINQVPVTVVYDKERQSRVVTNILRYALRTFLTIARTTRDYAPLMIFGTMAAMALIPGLALALFSIFHFVTTGSFSPYIFITFTAAYLITASAALFILGLVADMLRGIRSNQERILYFSKRKEYGYSSADET